MRIEEGFGMGQETGVGTGDGGRDGSKGLGLETGAEIGNRNTDGSRGGE